MVLVTQLPARFQAMHFGIVKIRYWMESKRIKNEPAVTWYFYQNPIDLNRIKTNLSAEFKTREVSIALGLEKARCQSRQGY